MLFQQRAPRKSHKVQLTLIQLADRLAPAVYTWVGSIGTMFDDWTNQAFWDSGDGTPGNDGYPGGPGHTTDTPKFDTLAANFRAPKINAGTSITVESMTVTSNWTREIAVDGDLTFYSSDMYGSGALIGDGFVDFSYNSVLGFPEGHTHYVTDSFGVKAKLVGVTGWLQFGGSGQVGYGAGGLGEWHVNGGKMDLKGTHSLGSDVTVYAGGAFRAIGTTSPATVALNHAGAANSGTYNLKSFVVSGSGTAEVESGIAFGLTGTRFQQTGGVTTLQTSASLSVGNNYLYADGARTYDKNVDVSGGTVNLYVGSAITTANGDHRYRNSEVNLYTPGWYNNGATQGVITLGAGYVMSGYQSGTSTVKFDGTTQTIRFRDYNYGTNPQQGGAKLAISQGKLHLDGDTKIFARVVLGGTSGGYDYIGATQVKVGGGGAGRATWPLS